ncbi:hypothetical protein FBUS_01044 [Fasciolopsis buskii]|uniref:Uncharacterized protein n=1 Tax=Fasciolopsis buskii TaxID=27845 RepID=A0A8E0VKV1_9TREM|nr:hypothetical protein FBUS_01044 [Fasciolopsis buski]
MSDSYTDLCGVRIRPAVVLVKDATPSSVQKITVTVQNISAHVKMIRIYPPKTKLVKLATRFCEVSIAPGIEHTGIVTSNLTTELTELVTDRLVITVNGEKIKIPLEIIPPRPMLTLPDTFNFGLLVRQNKVIHQVILLKNEGLKPGTFRITLSSNPLLEIVPRTGVVPEESSLNLTVGIGGLPEKAVPSSLGKCTRRICFKPMYYNTDKFCRWYLANRSPKATDFVSVLCNQSDKSQLGSNQSSPANVEDKPVELNSTLEACLDSLIDMIPCYGRLEPYSQIPVHFRLCPRWPRPVYGFQVAPEQPPQKAFSVYLKITEVGLISNQKTETQGKI